MEERESKIYQKLIKLNYHNSQIIRKFIKATVNAPPCVKNMQFTKSDDQKINTILKVAPIYEQVYTHRFLISNSNSNSHNNKDKIITCNQKEQQIVESSVVGTPFIEIKTVQKLSQISNTVVEYCDKQKQVGVDSKFQQQIFQEIQKISTEEISKVPKMQKINKVEHLQQYHRQVDQIPEQKQKINVSEINCKYPESNIQNHDKHHSYNNQVSQNKMLNIIHCKSHIKTSNRYQTKSHTMKNVKITPKKYQSLVKYKKNTQNHNERYKQQVSSGIQYMFSDDNKSSRVDANLIQRTAIMKNRQNINKLKQINQSVQLSTQHKQKTKQKTNGVNSNSSSALSYYQKFVDFVRQKKSENHVLNLDNKQLGDDNKQIAKQWKKEQGLSNNYPYTKNIDGYQLEKNRNKKTLLNLQDLVFDSKRNPQLTQQTQIKCIQKQSIIKNRVFHPNYLSRSKLYLQQLNKNAKNQILMNEAHQFMSVNQMKIDKTTIDFSGKHVVAIKRQRRKKQFNQAKYKQQKNKKRQKLQTIRNNHLISQSALSKNSENRQNFVFPQIPRATNFSPQPSCIQSNHVKYKLSSVQQLTEQSSQQNPTIISMKNKKKHKNAKIHSIAHSLTRSLQVETAMMHSNCQDDVVFGDRKISHPKDRSLEKLQTIPFQQLRCQNQR